MGEFAEMAMEQEMAARFDDVISEIFGGKKTPKRVNRFIEHRKVNDKVWLMRDKVEILITKMETDHIVKCLVLLTRAKQTDTKAYEGMMHELEKREAVCDAQKIKHDDETNSGGQL